MAHGLSCSVACGIFPDQGSNPYPLHWQADSQPLCHQGSPPKNVFIMNSFLKFSANPKECAGPLDVKSLRLFVLSIHQSLWSITVEMTTDHQAQRSGRRERLMMETRGQKGTVISKLPPGSGICDALPLR